MLEQIGIANFELGKRGTEVDRVFLYLQSMKGMWIYSKSLSQKFYYAGFDLTNDQLTNIVLLIRFSVSLGKIS